MKKIKLLYLRLIALFHGLTNIVIKNNKGFKLKISNSHEIMRAVTFSEKEPEMIDWINDFKSNYRSDNFTFFDVGANVGIYSLYTAANYPNSKIYSFEPEATNFSSLCLNINSNNFFNIHPYQIALSFKEGFEDLHVALVESGAGAAAIGLDYKNLKGENRNFLQGIYTTTLDDLVFKHGFKTPNFIKIDVDGFELDILKGAHKLLSSNSLIGMIIEFEFKNETQLKDMIKILKNNHFNLIKKSEWVDYSINGHEIRNFIFKK
jgi:FkbM family methyltransferase